MYWYINTLVHWYDILVHLYIDKVATIVHWYIGISAHWQIYMLVYCYISTLAHWYTVILVH